MFYGKTPLSHSQPCDLGGIGASTSFRNGLLLALLEPYGSLWTMSLKMRDTELHKSFDSITGESRPAGQPPEDEANAGFRETEEN